MKTALLLLLLTTQTPAAKPLEKPFPPVEQCSRVWIQLKSFWSIHCFSSGSAEIAEGTMPSLRRLPKGSLDFTEIHRSLVTLPAPALPDQATIHVTFVLRESAPQPDGVRAYHFTFADTGYARKLFQQIMDAPGGYRWKDVDEWRVKHPPFPTP